MKPAFLVTGLAIGLLLLVGAGFLISKQQRVKPDFDPAVLIQAGVAIIVGFVLTQMLTLKVAERRTEREVVVRQIEAVLARLEELACTFESVATPTAPIRTGSTSAWLLKRLSTHITTLDALLKRFGFNARESLMQELRLQLRNLRYSNTERLNPTTSDQVNSWRAYTEMRRRLALLVFEINKQ